MRELFGLHALIEKYEPLRKMLEQNKDVKMYFLGDKDLLIEGPTSTFPIQLPEEWAHVRFLFGQALEPKKAADTIADSEEQKSDFMKESKELNTKAEELFALTRWPQDFDLKAVKEYLKNPKRQLREDDELMALSGIKKEFLLITFSEPMSKLFKEIPEDLIETQLYSHAGMLLGGKTSRL